LYPTAITYIRPSVGGAGVGEGMASHAEPRRRGAGAEIAKDERGFTRRSSQIYADGEGKF